MSDCKTIAQEVEGVIQRIDAYSDLGMIEGEALGYLLEALQCIKQQLESL